MLHRTLWLAVLLLGVGSIAPGLTGEGRTAEAKCWPNRVDNDVPYHDGRIRHPASAPTGVRSYIVNYSPWVMFEDQVMAWSMLTRTPNLNQWAQVGWLEFPGDVRNTFVQYTPDHYTPPPPPGGSGYTTVLFPSQPLGISTEYRVQFRTNHFDFFYDDVYLGAGNVSWTPNEGQLAGETHTLASQMPGDPSSSEWFSLSQIEYGGWGGWYNFGGAAAPVPLDRHFGQQIYSSSQQRIWDRCVQ